MATRFQGIAQGPRIEAFALNKEYEGDTAEKKVNLGAGVYRTEEGLPWVLPVVKKVELQMAQNDKLNHEYLPVLGLKDLCDSATELLLGSDSEAIKTGKAFGVQSLSGTGALRVAAEVLHRLLNYNTFYISKPSWENHNLIFYNSGFTDGREYRYWDQEKRGIDFEGLIEDLETAPENSVIILHACAHNPTGCDPTKEQWTRIAQVMKANKLFPMFDSAYQGFASGDPDLDAWPVRYFVSQGFELLCAQSFAKNFGLYNERVGNLTFVVNDLSAIGSLLSQVTLIVRAMYSNPPNHGARIVSTILKDPQLRKEWKECIQTMSGRVLQMRSQLRCRLEAMKVGGTWGHITTQIGMFSYTGLTEEQVERLVKEYHIYLFKSGRINMCGLNSHNIDYVARAVKEVVGASL